MVRTAFISPAVAACLLLLAACDGGDPDTPNPTSTSTATAAPSSATASPTTVALPPYLAALSDDERDAYAAAVQDYERFSSRNADLYRLGKATPAAKLYYKRSTAAWQSYWGKLKGFESQGIRIFGRGEVVRMRPAAVRLGRWGGGAVKLRVCSVARGVKVVQNGELVPQPSPAPTITRVSMVKQPHEKWWRILSDRAGGKC